MPVFDYICPECQKEFEQLVRRFDDSVSCPQCGCQNAKRLMSAPAAHASSSACPQEESCAAHGHSCCGGCCSHHH